MTLEQTNHNAAIIDLVTCRDWVTFVEIRRLLEDRGMDCAGDQCIFIPERPNTIVWAGMSQAFTDVMTGLIGQRIFTWPAQIIIYMVDGGMLNMPLAKRPRVNQDYKQPHWLPVAFRLEPYK